jgi:hypothetical protein
VERIVALDQGHRVEVSVGDRVDITLAPPR